MLAGHSIPVDSLLSPASRVATLGPPAPCRIPLPELMSPRPLLARRRANTLLQCHGHRSPSPESTVHCSDCTEPQRSERGGNSIGLTFGHSPRISSWLATVTNEAVRPHSIHMRKRARSPSLSDSSEDSPLEPRNVLAVRGLTPMHKNSPAPGRLVRLYTWGTENYTDHPAKRQRTDDSEQILSPMPGFMYDIDWREKPVWKCVYCGHMYGASKKKEVAQHFYGQGASASKRCFAVRHAARKR
ncbi:hypothetical protein BKA62DRAFT_375985 [Auriculariales sp. MPI-PUGE-AT-0066]|nr:hypothetical protein BKA62DRAFT_375985 [Auriculariales sp. MPI-PUGE-AT-0066]